MQRVLWEFRGGALDMMWRLRVDFPEWVLSMPGKERQQGPMVGVGVGLPGDKAKE